MTVNAERECTNLDHYVGKALLEAANRVDVQDGSASGGKLLSHSFDHGSVEVHVGYTATGSSPAEGLASTSSANTEGVSGNVGAVGQAEKADTAVYRQPSQREILEQSLVHGAASEVAAVPTKAGAIAEGIKTLLDALHPAPVGQELSMINSLCKHANKVMDEGLAHHMSGAGVAVSGGLAAPKAESVHTQGIAHQVGQLVITAEMVSRFLSWPLPDDFGPDGGIYIDRRPSVTLTGTNLLNFAQTKAMLEHCINGPKGPGSREA